MMLFSYAYNAYITLERMSELINLERLLDTKQHTNINLISLYEYFEM